MKSAFFGALMGAFLLSPVQAQTTNIVFGASIDRNYIALAKYDVGTVSCRPELSRCVEGTSWVQIVSAMRGENYVNNAVESYMAADQVPLMYATTPAAGMRFFIGNFDLNDYCWNGTDADKRANTGAMITAGVYWLGAGTRLSGRDVSITYTGTWTNSPLNTIGKYSTTNGATASFAFNGTYLAIGTQIQDSNLGAFTLSIDGGTPLGPFSNNGQNGKGVDTKLRLECVFGTSSVPCWANAGIVVSGLSAGTHTAKITVTSATGPAVYFDWAGSGSNGLPIFVLAPTRHAPGGYAANCTHPSPAPSDTDQAAYSAQKQAIVTSAAANGLNIQFVDAQSVLDPSKPSFWQLDLEHPAGDGNAVYAAFIKGVLP